MTDRLGPYLLGPNDTPENGIYTGDARELSKAIPDESVDLIFTDPVYQNIDDYRWLAEAAARLLKPDAPLLVWYATPSKPEILDALRKGGLRYRWDLALILLSGPGGSILSHLVCKRTDCLWMDRSHTSRTQHRIWDIHIGLTKSAYKLINPYKWAKDPTAIARWIAAFSPAESLVFDPFCGYGTVPAVCKMLGRRYLAFEIDPDVAETARERVRNTQMPLFVLEPEQERMQLE